MIRYPFLLHGVSIYISEMPFSPLDIACMTVPRAIACGFPRFFHHHDPHGSIWTSCQQFPSYNEAKRQKALMPVIQLRRWRELRNFTKKHRPEWTILQFTVVCGHKTVWSVTRSAIRRRCLSTIYKQLASVKPLPSAQIAATNERRWELRLRKVLLHLHTVTPGHNKTYFLFRWNVLLRRLMGSKEDMIS